MRRDSRQWVQLREPHGFACNTPQCPNGADYAYTDDQQDPNHNAYDLLCEDCYNDRQHECGCEPSAGLLCYEHNDEMGKDLGAW